jgi:hypothetical protein
MKVRITQAVSLTEIPDRLNDMIEQLRDSLETVYSLTDSCSETSRLKTETPVKYLLIRDCLSKLRAELSSLDQQASDLDTILEGYIKIISPTPDVPNSSEVNDVD